MTREAFGDGVPLPGAPRSREFGDGVPLPQAPHAIPDDGLPKLEDAYRLAMDARSRGEIYIVMPASGAGRAWAPYVSAFGVRGLVVVRERAMPTASKPGEGKGLDVGGVGRILIRFPVVEVLLAWRRAEMARLNPVPRQLRMNQRRRRPRNVMIR